jgi:hypothetical protein
MIVGDIRKLKTQLKDPVDYFLPIGKEKVHLNPLIGKVVELTHSGAIHCIDTGKEIKKSFGQGYSFESYMTLARCDSCLFNPEYCHYSKGTCREPKWGEEHCLIPHYIYLANTSGLKVGITRETQVPTRWIDQGASQAIPIFIAKDRLTSGLVEVELAKKLNDKTNWRSMLKKEIKKLDLVKERERIHKEYKDLIKKYDLKVCKDELVEISFPDEAYPEKLTSLNFDKYPLISGTLLGIKGQYLIFDCGVLNIRRHQGYEISLNHE